jgi:hypothetical protein
MKILRYLLLAFATTAWAQGIQGVLGGSGTTNHATYIPGDGSTDNTSIVQAAVNACSGSCSIVLVNAVIAGTVNLPTTADINFTAVGRVSITGTGTAFYRYQATNTTPVTNRVTFKDISFSKSSAGIIIWDDLVFNSSTNMGITVHGCHFQISNVGAVAIALSGDSGTVITDNVFDTGPGLVGAAIKTVTDNIGGNNTIRTPMLATIANNTFRYGTAFTQAVVTAGADPGEGFTFTGNHFDGASVSASGTEINFIGNEFVGVSLSLKDLSDSTFAANYVDSGNVAGNTLLSLDNVIQQTITSNTFIAAGQINTTAVAFVNPRSLSAGTTTVTLRGNIYVGASSTSTGGFGIVFNDPVARNVYVGGENFRQLYAALSFSALLDKSTIDRFEARDVFYYAQNISTYHGTYLRSDPVYAQYEVHLTGTVYSAGAKIEIGSTTLAFPSMFNNPVVSVATVTGVSGAPCTANTFPAPSNGGNSASPASVGISLYSTTGATVGFAACDATVTLDDSLYVGPR